MQTTWKGTIWPGEDGTSVEVLNQLALPHRVEVLRLETCADACRAIADMVVRGAGLIGNTASYGMWLAALELAHEPFDVFLEAMRHKALDLKSARPTASNLAWAVDRHLEELEQCTGHRDVALAVTRMRELAIALDSSEQDACRRIGEYGKSLVQEMIAKKGGRTLNILTHCNAGMLAFAGYGSSLAPVYAAHAAGAPVHVWVDETRPRNQGASLTAWELARHGVPHTLIVDNAGGHLMQHGMVDMVIVGADRVTRRGDTANKIGTYLKALAAHDNDIPFYVALPSSTFDLSLADGVNEIPIEERSGEEVRYVEGLAENGQTGRVLICPEQTTARNWGFDVTPARLVTASICERGICRADEAAIVGMLR